MACRRAPSAATRSNRGVSAPPHQSAGLACRRSFVPPRQALRSEKSRRADIHRVPVATALLSRFARVRIGPLSTRRLPPLLATHRACSAPCTKKCSLVLITSPSMSASGSDGKPPVSGFIVSVISRSFICLVLSKKILRPGFRRESEGTVFPNSWNRKLLFRDFSSGSRVRSAFRYRFLFPPLLVDLNAHTRYWAAPPDWLRLCRG